MNSGLETEVDDALKKLQISGKGMVQCRHCRMDHWLLKCPYKDQLAQLNKETAPTSGKPTQANQKGGPAIYVPPNMREGGNKRGETMAYNRYKEDSNTIRVTNLPADTEEQDLRELFFKLFPRKEGFGRMSRIFLAKDRKTGLSKGFAFVSFERREDATIAVGTLNGYGYGNLILNVEWAEDNN